MLRMEREFAVVAVGIWVLAAGTGTAPAGTIGIPNASFESPYVELAVPYATSDIADWQKAPMPDWWPTLGYTAQQWIETAGVFVNLPFAPVGNVDGRQAAFLFATPEAELFQDLDARFEIGQAYDLTVSMQGGGNPTYTPPMKAGVTMEIRLYYRDESGHRVTVGSAVVTNPTENYRIAFLADHTLHVPAVTAADAWAGKPIGVQLISTVSLADAGGFWDIDNVRLTAIPEPASLVLLAVGVWRLSVRRTRIVRRREP